jgi:hypothetical protein
MRKLWGPKMGEKHPVIEATIEKLNEFLIISY